MRDEIETPAPVSVHTTTMLRGLFADMVEIVMNRMPYGEDCKIVIRGLCAADGPGLTSPGPLQRGVYS
jgi:hypothetical protein